MQLVLVGEKLRQALVELGYRIGLVESEHLGGERRAVAEAVPDLALEVFLAAEKDRARLRAERHREDRLGLAEAGEVEEAAVPAIVVVGVGVAVALGRRRQDHDAGTEGLRELRAALAQMLDGQGGVEFHALILPPSAARDARA